MNYFNSIRAYCLWAGLFLFTISLSAQTPYYFPERGAEWETKPAQDLGFDAKKLAEAVEFAESHEYSGPRDLRQAILKGFEREPFHQILGPTKKRGGPAGMILRNGYVVAQWGDTRRVDMTFSVTKSYLSTVAGLAFAEGLIQDLNDPVGRYVWDGTFGGAHNAKINWSHLLTQSSDWNGQLWGGYDWADRPPREGELDDWQFRSLNEPGTVFEYNDVRVNVLSYSLLNVWRKPLPIVLREQVMDPIGASPTWRWYGYENSWVNIDGLEMQSVSGGGHSGGGLFISAEDHARFGMLFLNQGRWGEQEIFPSSWIKAATTPSAANANYGYMWWLNQSSGTRYWEGVPESVYYAAGFGGNYIVVAPEQDIVIVCRWLEPSQAGEMMKKVFESIK
ncbi:MAG: serine hydrolase [Bacteroidota bacterium]